MIVTHDGRFHVDELFAITFLAKFILNRKVGSLKIIRTRDETVIQKHQNDDSVYVIDVGEKYDPTMKNFDHHQVDPDLVWDKQIIGKEKIICSKINLSACGLMWRECLLPKYGLMEKLGEKLISKISEIAQQVDLCDNGLLPWNLTPIFSRYNYFTPGKNNEFKDFMTALYEVEKFINNIILNSEKEKDIVKVKNKINSLFENFICKNHIRNEVIFEMESEMDSFEGNMIAEYCSFFNNKDKKEELKSIDNFFISLRNKAEYCIEGKSYIKHALNKAKEKGHEKIVLFEDKCYDARIKLNELSDKVLIYATYYSDKNEWAIMSVNKYKDDPYTGRILMPELWAGKRGEELDNISGSKGMVYAHKMRFLVLMKGDEKDCLEVCEKILELSKEEK